MNNQHRKPTAPWIERRMRQGEVLAAAAEQLSANDTPAATVVVTRG